MTENPSATDAERVKSARRQQGWSQERLAEEARVAPNTVGALERGATIRDNNRARILRALDLVPADETWRDGLPPDVLLVVEVVGMWLAELPEAERPAAAYRLMRHLGAEKVTPG